MITANISTTKNELSRYLDAVRGGETVLILDRNRPIAQIQPLSGKHQASSARLDELSANGLISRPKAIAESWPTRLQTPEGPAKTSLGSLDALLEERDSGR
ncbi:MAG TPA: type II toxin-antitoxin system prevent-host-death family antitoxin [Opitutales bacterium]|nr:type II toxin-antitoxin system prevent-host-death family antitoxin [Opitutales bacterium]